MPLYLGLDCGGSSTRAVVEDGEGRTVFEGRGGSANLATTPRETVVRSLLSALKGAPSVDVSLGCFAGLVGPKEADLAVSVMEEAGLSGRLDARPDYWAALAACDERTDAVVIAGTGSVIASWDAKGGVLKTGGGGPLYGDLGSAFDVARRALRCVFIEFGEATTPRFSRAVSELYGTDDPTGVVSALNSATAAPSQAASLAPVVGADAAEGAPYAVQAVRGAMDGLAESVRPHLGAAGTVALAGGLWDAHPVFSTVFATVLATGNEIGPAPRPTGQYHVERLMRPPVFGAVRLARRLSHGH